MLPTCIAKEEEYALAYIRLKGRDIYLQYRYQLFNNPPALVVELILPQLERLVCCNAVNRLPILEGKRHHIMR
jgi:hypothetical protein